MCTTVNTKQNVWPQWTKWHDDLRRIQDAKTQTCLNDKLQVQFPTSYFKISNNVPRCCQRKLIAWICVVDFPSVSLNTIRRSQSADEIAFTEYKTVYILLTNERKQQIRPWLSFTYVFNVEKTSSTVWLMCQNNRGTTKNSVPVKTNEK